MTGTRYEILQHISTGGTAPSASQRQQHQQGKRRKPVAEPNVTTRHSRTTTNNHGNNYRRRPPGPTILISDANDCRKAVRKLSKCNRIAVDCEGVGLSRNGKLCLMQIASEEQVYVFDVVTAGDAMFSSGGLKALLEDHRVCKIMHDCRHDSDALFHQFGVRLGPVVDTQIEFLVLRRVRGKPEGLPVSLKTLLKKFSGASEQDLMLKHGVKDEMRGDGDFWLKRPLSQKALHYARLDVEHLLHVTEVMRRYIRKADKDAWEKVLEGSRQYVEAFRDDDDGPRKAQVQYEEMARLARRERNKFEKKMKAEFHEKNDPMRKFSFDVTGVLQALAI